VQILFAINNMMLKNHPDAFKQFQRMVMMYPDNYGYVYNLAAFMHVALADCRSTSRTSSR